MLTTASSSGPSPLKSPAAIDCGFVATGPLAWTWKVPSPSPFKIEAVLEAVLATARSRCPLPVKFPTAIAVGKMPTV